MILEFAKKESDKAYISNSLWLPKSEVRVGPVKRALEFTVNTREGQDMYRLWGETRNHIVAPREFLSPSDYPKYKFPFIDLRAEFEKMEFEDLVTPRNEEQWNAWNAFSMHDNGILNLGCGKGKTKLALKKIAQRSVPTLVIVPDGGILDQWRRSINGDKKQPPGLKVNGELGLIAGQDFDWKRPITLALVTSLALRIRDGRLPEEMYRYFGQIIYDEVHQLGAPMFSLTAGPFYGDRIGLTATVQREDGLDPIFRYHIGEPFYSDLTQDLVPDIFFNQTPAKVNLKEAEVNGRVNISKLRTLVGKDLVGNTFRYWMIKKAIDAGRKVICLSHSKAQLKLLHAMFPGSAIITAEVDRDERTDILRNSQLCFAIARLGAVGVDDDSLDTLFWLTPFSSKIALQQSMGRIQRIKEGKKQPVMVVFEDWYINPMKNLCTSIRRTLKSWNYTFSVVKPLEPQLPEKLPPSVQAIYEQTLNSLIPEEDDDNDD